MHSYPKIYALDHAAGAAAGGSKSTHLPIRRWIQEKLDGSQFSFGLENGVLRFRSRGAEIDPLAPPDLFAKAVAHVSARFAAHPDVFVEGRTHRGEALKGPKHNILAYETGPAAGYVLFDVDDGDQQYVTSNALLEAIALNLGCTFVPFEYIGDSFPDPDTLAELVARPSILGGKREGVVLKSYGRYHADGKTMMAKLVTSEFKEKHKAEWPSSAKDKQSVVLEHLAAQLRVPARWAKAVQRRREQGLEPSVQQIGALLGEIAADIRAEETAWIKDQLFERFSKEIIQGATKGFPLWYKSECCGIATVETLAGKTVSVDVLGTESPSGTDSSPTSSSSDPDAPSS